MSACFRAPSLPSPAALVGTCNSVAHKWQFDPREARTGNVELT